SRMQTHVHTAHDLPRAFRRIMLLENLNLELQVLLEARRRAHLEFRIVKLQADIDDLFDCKRHGMSSGDQERMLPNGMGADKEPVGWVERLRDPTLWNGRVGSREELDPTYVSLRLCRRALRSGMRTLMLHFAYGSNMNRALMQARCPDAHALGTAALSGWRFVIGPDGYASVIRQPGGRVHGVLWRLSARDAAAVNAYESIQSGLYLLRSLAVRHGKRGVPALVYVARRQGEGIPRPGYLDAVIEAALDWNLPPPYIRSIARWSRSGFSGAHAKETGETGPTLVALCVSVAGFQAWACCR